MHWGRRREVRPTSQSSPPLSHSLLQGSPLPVLAVSVVWPDLSSGTVFRQELKPGRGLMLGNPLKTSCCPFNPGSPNPNVAPVWATLSPRRSNLLYSEVPQACGLVPVGCAPPKGPIFLIHLKAPSRPVRAQEALHMPATSSLPAYGPVWSKCSMCSCSEDILSAYYVTGTGSTRML